MAVCVLFADAAYPQVIAAAQAKIPGLAENEWKVRSAAYLAEKFHAADAWSAAFRALGCEAEEVVLDRDGALAEAIEDGTPWDVVVLRHPHLCDLDKAVLDRGPRVVCMVTSDAAAWEWTMGSPFLHVTSFPQYAEKFAWLYLPLAFDPRRAEYAKPWAERAIPVSFVGSLGYGQWPQGMHAVSAVAERIPGFAWWGLKCGTVTEALDRTYRGEAFGDDYFRILGDTKLALNRHGAINLVSGLGWEAANARLFEATALGCLLLTEEATNLRELFVTWEEACVYQNPTDLVRLVRHYQEHDDRASEIAAAGQARTMRNHLYSQRAATLLGLIEEVLKP